jgi:hypothetical protein
MSQMILVTFKQYPYVFETIHVKLSVEEWSMVQTLHQGLIALLALRLDTIEVRCAISS